MTMRRWMRAPMLLTLAVPLALAGCSSGSSKTSSGSGGCASTVASGDVNVTIKNFSFSPCAVTMKLGKSITFTNEDSTVHTATVTAGQPGSFDSGNLSQGKSATYTPTALGTYSYICSIHQYMSAKFTVAK